MRKWAHGKCNWRPRSWLDFAEFGGDFKLLYRLELFESCGESVFKTEQNSRVELVIRRLDEISRFGA